MANTPLAPPPATNANGNTPQPQAPADQAAVIAPPDAASVAGNDDRFSELEQQVQDVFAARAKDTTPAAPDSAGADAGAVVVSPADSAPAPAETLPPVSAPLTPPVAESVPEAPVAPAAYDPFALPSPPEPVAAATPPATPPAAHLGGDTPSATPPGYVDFLGAPIPVAEAQSMRDVFQWATSLTPEEANEINQLIQARRTGQAPPAQPPQPIQQTPVPPNYAQPGTTYPQPQPAWPGTPVAPPQIDPSTIDDPQLANFLNQQQQWFAQQNAQQQQVIAQQQQQLAQVAQQAQSQTDLAIQRQVAETNLAIDQARWDFAVQYALTPEELRLVEDRLVASGLAPVLVERKGGDVHAGLIDGLTTTAWTDPTMRERFMAQATAPAVTDAREIQGRAAKVGSLGGSGGSVPVQSTPVSQQDRHNAMVGEIAAAMNGNPS